MLLILNLCLSGALPLQMVSHRLVNIYQVDSNVVLLMPRSLICTWSGSVIQFKDNHILDITSIYLYLNIKPICAGSLPHPSHILVSCSSGEGSWEMLALFFSPCVNTLRLRPSNRWGWCKHLPAAFHTLLLPTASLYWNTPGSEKWKHAWMFFPVQSYK